VSSETAFELGLPGARAVFSTRRGGVSEGPYESLNLGILTDDDPDRVIENRRRVAGAARIAPERVGMGWQVHGTDLLEWNAPPTGRSYAEPRGRLLPQVDGHLTVEPNLALLVLVADCYPVALSDGAQAARRRRWSARGSAAAATRSARRCSRRSRTWTESRAAACSTYGA
jgi:polyphenol oxidase